MLGFVSGVISENSSDAIGAAGRAWKAFQGLGDRLIQRQPVVKERVDVIDDCIGREASSNEHRFTVNLFRVDFDKGTIRPSIGTSLSLPKWESSPDHRNSLFHFTSLPKCSQIVWA
jgi:hypothetical protein